MPRKKKVENLPGFEKDTVTNAVINTNSTAFSNRREQRSIMKSKDAELEQMKKDLEEIKTLLKKLGKK
jgi:hypothetical protein